MSTALEAAVEQRLREHVSYLELTGRCTRGHTTRSATSDAAPRSRGKQRRRSDLASMGAMRPG